MKRFWIIIVLLLVSLSAICQQADLIITNATVITVTIKGQRSQAVAVRDGRIISVGTNEEALRYKGTRTVLIDAKGATLVPGLTDAHMHPSPELSFDELGSSLHVDTVTSMTSLIQLIARKATITPKGMLIRAYGYNESKLGGEPTTTHTDKATGDHPVIIVHASGHKSAANSYLLRLNHITKETKDPQGGAYDRYPDGTPDGICKEAAEQGLTTAKGVVQWPKMGRAREIELYKRYFDHLHSFGITSIGDAGVDTAKLNIYKALAADGYPMRFNVMISERWLPLILNGTIKKINTNTLRVMSVKTFHGNSLSGKTCWLSEPYEHYNPDGSENAYYGIPPKRTQQELDSVFLAIHKAGWQICVHSNGDREIAMVLTAMERAETTGNPLQIRDRIEHCSVSNDSIIMRIKRLQVVPVLHCYINELGGLLGPYGKERLNKMFATRSFLEAGVLPALHSDAPISNYDIRQRWESAVLRKAPDGTVLGPDQRIDAEDALTMLTKGGANATGELDKKGTIETGKMADLVMILEDPTQIAPEDLHNLHILKTWVGGKVVYEAGQ